MNKKLLVISGIVLIMLLTLATIPVSSDANDSRIFGRKHITAIGTFTHCDTDEVIYGHIFIGFIGIKPVLNLDIEICEDSIKLIIMTNHFLHCVVKI